MSTSAIHISNLLYRYAECLDAGQLIEAAELFCHARIKVQGQSDYLDHTALLGIWQQRIRIYPCGTPRTRHIISNPIIDIDEDAGTATIRSCYTVLQATATLPLQSIATGRYIDEFERVDGVWRFSFRDYSHLEMIGDLSEHLLMQVH
ncbi:nuclear transport factor 2 family protein [Pseudomonas moorei]|uniref:SnoaL-like domain-containing protein n=1 Tax=Pseudomonas moorei TaxID=395599 RepID=A0A1H1GRV4_9PSED|nr:nuclear transport factor 2 family protein [Pseudomonas moorei]KAB0498052.1 nuclear transport factor 2 family protein [Pseudomonas moorei]SDR15638.1 SnoaL-like domain-containing protein [Pseudomonas moorei]